MWLAIVGILDSARFVKRKRRRVIIVTAPANRAWTVLQDRVRSVSPTLTHVDSRAGWDQAIP